MPTRVSDPGVLAQLNSGAAQPVTDPNILAQLNGTIAPQNAAQPGWGRSLGLDAGAIARGVMALPETLADIPTGAYNVGADLIQGKGKGFRFNEQNQNLAKALSAWGLPEPQTNEEKIDSGIVQGIGGAASGLGLGNALASSAEPVTAAVGNSMTAMPVRALASGAAAGGASSGAAALGASAPVQIGAGLLAGTLPFASPTAFAHGGDLTPNEQQATNAGYKLPPATMANPSVLSKVLGGWSGKIKSQQAASTANQEVTTGIAKQDLGLPDDSTLDDSTFDSIRGTAGQAYQAVKSAIPTINVDEQFQTDAATLGQLNSELAKEFPELVKNDDISSLAESLANKTSFSTTAGMDAVKTLRASATKLIGAQGDPQKNALGFAQRQAADAIDSLIERNLSNPQPQYKITTSGTFVMPGPDTSQLVPAYKAARQLIAKSYDVQAATNPATGDVSASKIAQIAQRRPIGGGLQTVADMANAFPKAVQSPAKFGGTEPLSVLDLMAALGTAGGATVAGRPLEGAGMAATILSRPAARALTMSGPYQSAMANPAPFNSASFLPSNLQPIIGALNNYGGQ